MTIALHPHRTTRSTYLIVSAIAIALALAVGTYGIVETSGDSARVTTDTPSAVQLNPAAASAVNGPYVAVGGIASVNSQLNPAAASAVNGPSVAVGGIVGVNSQLNPAAASARNG